MNIKHYKPGDPEFDAIAKQITPIDRVHNSSYKTTYIDAERSGPRTIKRKRGSLNEL